MPPSARCGRAGVEEDGTGGRVRGLLRSRAQLGRRGCAVVDEDGTGREGVWACWFTCSREVVDMRVWMKTVRKV
eukprot:223332-Chlamydomonas_euryale.AAC.2